MTFTDDEKDLAEMEQLVKDIYKLDEEHVALSEHYNKIMDRFDQLATKENIRLMIENREEFLGLRNLAKSMSNRCDEITDRTEVMIDSYSSLLEKIKKRNPDSEH